MLIQILKNAIYKRNDAFYELYKKNVSKDIRVVMPLFPIQPVDSVSGYLLSCSVMWAVCRGRRKCQLDPE
jgi:hypothetical protein